MATNETKSRKRKSTHKADRQAKSDVYERVTHSIVESLERGVRPWLRPWSVEHAAGRVSRPLRHSGEPYQGVNILMLWASAEEQGFACPYWLTFRQAKELGGHVRKGEKGSPVVYASTFKKNETDEQGEEVESEIPFLKSYAQAAHRRSTPSGRTTYAFRRSSASATRRRTLRPWRMSFATGLGTRRGSTFLCADLSITSEVRDDHASYIGTWLEALKHDKRAIFLAASHASRVVNYLHDLQPYCE